MQYGCQAAILKVEGDSTENKEASAHRHKQYAYEIWNWNFKANLSYGPETMSSTDGWTDRQADEQTDKVIPVHTPPPPPPPPPNFVGWGYNKLREFQLLKCCNISWDLNFYLK